jgi:hypothetical protein
LPGCAVRAANALKSGGKTMSNPALLRLLLVTALLGPLAVAADDPKPTKSDTATKPALTTPRPAPQPATVKAPIPSNATSSVPNPIERTRALTRVGLQPTNLQSGRAVTYSADRLGDNDGLLDASSVNLFRRDGRWLFSNTAEESGQIRIREELLQGSAEAGGPALEFARGPGLIGVTFATRAGQRYLVDFAIDSSATFTVLYTEGRGSQAPLEGHVPVVVTGNGTRRRVALYGQGFTFHYVRVIPIA